MNTLRSGEKGRIYKKFVEQPLVPMTLRIGVAGHRKLTEPQRAIIRTKLPVLYSEIEEITGQLNKSAVARSLYSDEPEVIRILSSLAEGADRLCIEEEIVSPLFQLGAVLPFAQDEYENDFLPSNSVIDKVNGTVEEFRHYLNKLQQENGEACLIELNGLPNKRDLAYVRCSQALVDHCDLLIAVFDGDRTKDLGTAATVNIALKAGVPVLHISTLAEGEVALFESDFYQEEKGPVPYTKELLQHELEKILLFSDLIEDKTSILKRFKRYKNEAGFTYNPDTEVDLGNSGPIRLNRQFTVLDRPFQLFKKLLTPRLQVDSLDTAVEQKEDHCKQEEPQDVKATVPATSHRFFSAFLRADQLANQYADIHRSTFLLIYLLGSMALITASFALALKSSLNWVLILVLIELLLLGTIYYLYRNDHRQDFHGRWLEYRCLAEFLRPLLFVNLIGRNYSFFTRQNISHFHNREIVGHQDSDRRWLYIYSQTVVRWTGFSQCSLTPEYQDTIRKFINRTWIKGQLDYHIDNATRMQGLAGRLSRGCRRLFFLTVAVVVLKLILLGCELVFHIHFPHLMTTGVALCTAIFPILASTAFAISNHAEFDLSAQRSLTMRASIITYYKLLKNNTFDHDDHILSQQIQNVAYETSKEASEWLEVYEIKEAEPA